MTAHIMGHPGVGKRVQSRRCGTTRPHVDRHCEEPLNMVRHTVTHAGSWKRQADRQGSHVLPLQHSQRLQECVLDAGIRGFDRHPLHAPRDHAAVSGVDSDVRLRSLLGETE
ncbi:hypothetical protein STXM2123_135 [Streptomyces sp. F-3]|nr:hypothetical protein STXM2123_135 [Streptomyces sp. F-3]